MSDKQDSLLIIERYDQCVDYLYPIIQNIARKHGQLRDAVLSLLLQIPGELYLSAKVKQVSKLYKVDASLAELRWMIRFMASLKLISKRQEEVVMVKLAEVGKLIGSQISTRKH